MLTCSMMRFLSLLLLGLCGSSWSVCGVVVVPYVVGVVVAMTVMHVLLFVLHVCMLQECYGVWVMAMLVWVPGEGVVAVSAYMGGTCGSGDMLEMSVVIGGVCDMSGLG